jgi:hypothetical protein
LSTTYGPHEATLGDVQAAQDASWDALVESGPNSAEAARTADLAYATHDNYRRSEARQAAGQHTMRQVTEVTRPDGGRFVSHDTDVTGLARLYRQEDGYSLRLVTGEHTPHGFRVAGPSELEAGS